jgi:hypothetical protein
MKPEMKLEGDVLKIKAAHSVQVDTDKDGEAAIKASVSLEIEADGSEVLAELLKSSSLAAKAKGLLEKLGLIKPEVQA